MSVGVKVNLCLAIDLKWLSLSIFLEVTICITKKLINGTGKQ